MEKKEKITPFRFKISGNLIKELGEESISNPNVAILELLKNAYDADATKVEIDLIDINMASNAKIVINDNGDGMNSDDINNKWMLIASPHKSEIEETDRERIPVGAKGIGRLASESLGRKTILASCPKGETSGYEIHFEWDKYRGKDVLCDDINNDGYRFKKKRTDQGIKIEISDLRTSWNDSDKLKELLKDIYLIHPLNVQIPDFKIIPRAGLSNITINKPTEKILDFSIYKLKAKLTSRNIVKYSFFVGNREHSSGTVKLDTSLECGDVSFELHFFYKIVGPYKERIGKEITQKELEDIKGFLEDYGGIKLYRDNFRVKPYGDRGFDWIRLDALAQDNTMCPRNDQIIGIVNISKLTNQRIVDTTTREGIIHTQEFLDLIRFIETAIMKIFIDKRSEVEADKKKARKVVATRKKKGVTPIVKVPEAKRKEADLIDVKGDYPQNFYYKLQDEINQSYIANYPNGAFFLSRKLVENLVFNILEKKFPNDAVLWFDTNRNFHLPLNQLIKNLYDKRNDFKPNTKKYIEKFYSEVQSFVKETNSKAHNIFDYLNNKDELDKFKIGDLVQLLINIYQTI